MLLAGFGQCSLRAQRLLSKTLSVRDLEKDVGQLHKKTRDSRRFFCQTLKEAGLDFDGASSFISALTTSFFLG